MATLFRFINITIHYMKAVFFTLLLFLPFFISAQTAKIKIDIDRTIGEIMPISRTIGFPAHSFTQIKVGAKQN